MTFSKSDIEYHVLGYGYDRAPAVNVKVREWPTDAIVEDVARDLGFDVPSVLAWWQDRAESDDALASDAFSLACEMGYSDLTDYAREIWDDPSLTVYAEGRSGGWAYVDSFRADDVETWDAIAVGRWARFARMARCLADDIPYQSVWIMVANHYPTAARNDGAMISA